MAPPLAGLDPLGTLLDNGPPRLIEPLEEQRVASAVERGLFGTGDPVTLDRYRIDAKIGQGGGGTVYRGHDPGLDRAVAIKVFHCHGARTQLLRLRREGQALARLSHPNVITVYDAFAVGDGVAVVMQWVDGTPVDKWLQTGRRSVSHILRVFAAAGRGLAAVHAAGWVHRDFKPANILLGADGEVRLADFGLAQRTDGSLRCSPEEAPSLSTEGDFESATLTDPTRVTQPGLIPGTPAYMAPESRRGSLSTPASDQYSLCASLFEALHGRLPGDPDREGEPTALGRIPSRVRRALRRGLDPDPSRRFASIDTLLAAIGSPATHVWWATGLLAGAVTVGVAVFGGSDDSVAGCDAEATSIGEVRSASMPAPLHDALSQYAQRWTATYRATCGAESDETQAVRTRRCLDVRRAEYRSFVDVLSRPDAPPLAQASVAVGELVAPDRCTVPEASALDQWQPPTPEDRERATRLRDRLSYARALVLAGNHREAAQSLDDLHADTVDAGFAPILMQVESERGGAIVLAGDPRRGRAVLTAAYEFAVANGFELEAARVAADLVFTVGYTLGDHEGGIRWGRHGQASLDRLGLAGEYQARLDGHLGSVEALAGRYPQAEHHHRQAEAVRRQHRDTAPIQLASTLNNLGNVLMVRNSLVESLAYHQEALALRREALGATHPHVAVSMNNLGSIRMMQGEWDSARALFVEALDVWETAVGPDHRDLVHPLNNLAAVATREGHPSEAEAYARRGLDLATRSYGTDDPRVAMMLLVLGKTLGAQGRHEEALETLFASLQIARAALGDEHDDVASVRHAIGGEYLETGRADEALAYLQPALTHWLSAYGPGNPNSAAAMLRSSLAELEQSRPLPARERLKALRDGPGYAQLGPGDQASTDFALARAIGRLEGRTPRAIELARHAARRLDRTLPDEAQLHAEIESWLDSPSKRAR